MPGSTSRGRSSGVFVEFDGKIKYEALLKPGESASDVVIREKRREERIVELTGWRLHSCDVVGPGEPRALLERIRKAFARRHAQSRLRDLSQSRTIWAIATPEIVRVTRVPG